MPYTTINKPADYFNTVTYTGNGSASGISITGVGFQPDLLWIKNRSSTPAHVVYDNVRTSPAKYLLQTNTTVAERTAALGSFDSDGFTVTDNDSFYNSAANFVAWNWKGSNVAGGSSNTDGSITSQVSVNTTSGFSIVSYTGNATGSATFGHGLGVKPKIVIIKNRSAAEGWGYWQDTTNNGTADIRMQLNATAANYNNLFVTFNTDTITLPSASDPSWNGSGNSLIAYCFADVKGFSKIGSYTGNGNADGPFVYTGFKPAMIIWKNSSNTYNWVISDNKRNTFNDVDKYLLPNTSDAEGTLALVDFLSNGFKIRTTDASINNSSDTIIYMAFAENPLVTTGKVPATAR